MTGSFIDVVTDSGRGMREIHFNHETIRLSVGKSQRSVNECFLVNEWLTYTVGSLLPTPCK